MNTKTLPKILKKLDGAGAIHVVQSESWVYAFLALRALSARNAGRWGSHAVGRHRKASEEGEGETWGQGGRHGSSARDLLGYKHVWWCPSTSTWASSSEQMMGSTPVQLMPRDASIPTPGPVRRCEHGRSGTAGSHRGADTLRPPADRRAHRWAPRAHPVLRPAHAATQDHLDGAPGVPNAGVHDSCAGISTPRASASYVVARGESKSTLGCSRGGELPPRATGNGAALGALLARDTAAAPAARCSGERDSLKGWCRAEEERGREG
ncbi:hypothetical protein C8F04DRAFT_1236838 [Mycena alexandri]|uniref:Uncharacterized protein n=1 Tax=Mycena alexandri TaxID=1745969 RepID=A0AAD6X062_9AGAR|nr:hypothetical protein C8F04DRAFT_1236838 [Mycena alexandri]